MKKTPIAVIGLGRFGYSLIGEFNKMGYEILAIDIDQASINKVRDIATHAVRADSMDEEVLKSLGIRNFDIVVVAIGDDIQANILTAITLKELGVKKVIAKAKNELHGKVLEKIGADIVVYPERDMAVKLAHSLVRDNIIDYINLSNEYSIFELLTPRQLTGKTLAASNLRQKFKVNLVAIKRGNEIIVTPTPEEEMLASDILILLGHNDNLEELSRLN